jgi:Mg2+/Co2+ transporter CorC
MLLAQVEGYVEQAVFKAEIAMSAVKDELKEKSTNAKTTEEI